MRNARRLLQGLYIVGNSFGILWGQTGDGFLVRCLLGILALGEQIGDLVGAEGGALQGWPNFALPLGPMAGGALRFVSGGSIGRECGHRDRDGQCEDDEQNNQFSNSHSVSPSVVRNRPAMNRGPKEPKIVALDVGRECDFAHTIFGRYYQNGKTGSPVRTTRWINSFRELPKTPAPKVK